MRLLAIIILVVAFLPCAAVSDVIVNEVLANEPGSFVLLEWIELYNNSDSAVSMADYLLDAGGSDVTFPSDLVLQPEQFYIVCRRLYGDSASPGFEDTWGDSSGVWGDTEFEAGIPVPLQATFSLTNRGEAVRLFRSDELISDLQWYSDGGDGISWERLTPDSRVIDLCIAEEGSTPGDVNSQFVVTDGAVIRVASYTPFDPNFPRLLWVTVDNLSEDTLYQVTLRVADRADMEILSMELGPMAPGAHSGLGQTLHYPPHLWVIIRVEVFDSAGTFYDFVEIIEIVEEYPPVIVSEFLANPKDVITTEWIELWNISDTVINFGTWQIGDANKRVPIADSEVLLWPGHYVVLADDEAEFALSYPGSDADVVEVASWPTLNNDGDSIILIDEFGFVADSLHYVEVFDANRTWSRREPDTSLWGRSADPGGTPGEENRVTIFEDAYEVTLDIPYQRISSSYGTPINASAPLGHSYTLKVFDRQGRVVRTLADNADFLAESYTWEGTTDSGARLPVGLYIVYFEVPGVGSAKETVAIIR